MDPDELHSFEQPLADGRQLIAIAAGELAAQAKSLLDTLAKLDAKGPRLADGSTIQFGCSRLKIRQFGPAAVLHVCEPDFLDDPDRKTVAHVSRTLRVLLEQTAMLQLTGEKPRDVELSQSFVCERGALADEEIYFERQEPAGVDSGWFVGRASAEARAEKPELEPADLVTLPLYRLLVDFPPALKLLALPTGYMGIFRLAQLVALFRPDGASVPLPDAAQSPL